MKHRARCSIVARLCRAKASRAGLRALCLSCALMACVTNDNVRGGGYWGTKGAVQGVADELQELSAAGRLPNQATMKDTVHQMAESAVNGAVVGAANGVKDAEVDAAIKRAIEVTFQTTDHESNQMLSSILSKQSPALEGLVRTVVSTSLSTVRNELRQTTQADLPQATRIVITDAVDSFATAMETEKVGKVRRDLVDTTGQLTYAASSNAVIGLRTELQKEETQKAVNDMAGSVTETILGKVKEQAKDTIDKSLVAVAVLLLAALGVIGFLLLRARAQIRALKLVTGEINKFEHARDLKQNIAKKAQQHAAVDRYLKEFLLDNRL
jgi:hypothetical protein